MHLEAPHLNFILPDLIVKLYVIEDSVDQTLDVWILVTKQLEHDLDHLCLVEDDVSGWLEE